MDLNLSSKNNKTSLAQRFSWQRVTEQMKATRSLQVKTFSERLTSFETLILQLPVYAIKGRKTTLRRSSGLLITNLAPS